MANKFTKSILERQEKERKAGPVKNESLPPISLEQSVPQATPALPPIPEREGPEKPTGETGYLSRYLTPKKQRQARNKTYYLDEAVINAVKRTAEAEHVTESKLVNDILSKLLNA